MQEVVKTSREFRCTLPHLPPMITPYRTIVHCQDQGTDTAADLSWVHQLLHKLCVSVCPCVVVRNLITHAGSCRRHHRWHLTFQGRPSPWHPAKGIPWVAPAASPPAIPCLEVKWRQLAVPLCALCGSFSSCVRSCPQLSRRAPGFCWGCTVVKTVFELVANIEPQGDFHVKKKKTKQTTSQTI